jgi:hypothetical protein
MMGLIPGTAYYVRGFATNISGTGYSEQLTFTTIGPYILGPTTITFSAANSNTFTLRSEIVSNGGKNVTAMGFCYGPNHNPTFEHNESVVDNIISLDFTLFLTSTPNTPKYWRAFAYNEAGVGYGAELAITDWANQPEADLVDIEGNVYKTVRIGNQIWTAKNLKTNLLNDGTPIDLVTNEDGWNSLTTPAYSYASNSEANISTYGGLYNWYAVNTGRLRPLDWHVPTYLDYSYLGQFLLCPNS